MMQNQFQDDIQQANALLQAEKAGDAYLAYRACLAEAGQARLTISIEQLSSIWMGIGSCYAARARWERALQWYHLSKTAVLSTAAFLADTQSATGMARRAKWQQYAPEGATTTLEHDAPNHALGELCEAITVAYENSDQPDRATLYHQHATSAYKRAEQTAVEPEPSADIETAVSEIVAADSPIIPDIDPYELGPIPLATIKNDNDALTILRHFGIRHFGATQRKWNVTADEFVFFKPDSEEPEAISGISLHLYGQLEQAVNVSFTMFQCRVVVAEKRPFADQDQPVFVAVNDELISPHVDTLIDKLEQMQLAL